MFLQRTLQPQYWMDDARILEMICRLSNYVIDRSKIMLTERQIAFLNILEHIIRNYNNPVSCINLS